MERVDVTLVAGISPATTHPGGIRTYVLGLARYLAIAGHGVSIVGIGASPPHAPFGFVQAVPRSHTTSVSFHRALRKLRRRRTLLGSVVHCQRPDDLAALRPLDGHSTVVTIHGDPYQGVRQRHGRVIASAYRRLERQGIEAADRVLFLNSSERRAFHQRYPNEATKFRDSDAGVDLNMFQPVDREAARARWDLGSGPHILFAGRFEAEKNPGILPKALEASQSRPTLILAGSGREAARLRHLLADLPHRFLGVVPNDEMPSLYSAMDATILPSAREAMPLACLESIACGTPVVASRVGRLVEVILPGRNGVFADVTAESLSQAIDRVIEDGGSMRASCRATVLRFGWNEIAPRLVQLYREIS